MHDIRLIWLALMLQLAVVIGVVGGALSWLGGANPAHAVLTGAGVFSGAVLLLLAVAGFLERR
ncbi:hypothetical protein [Streptomyces sp. NBC_01794]|uniref:hypothetical protein n=1 Tax=Streptomyces sp. NBC_01794 TaxID=2975942 RepID=UPI00308CEA11|nr:hypothetical protein OIE54_40955 [Streptomyces sp. NBC_01794]